jgi:hypothetical protein
LQEKWNELQRLVSEKPKGSLASLQLAFEKLHIATDEIETKVAIIPSYMVFRSDTTSSTGSLYEAKKVKKSGRCVLL